MRVGSVSLLVPLLCASFAGCAPAAESPHREAAKAIGEVDVVACSELLPGSAVDPVVHVTVDFADDGSVARARVDLGEERIGARAANCLEEKFRALVGPRSGRITMGRAFRMRPHAATESVAAFDRSATAQVIGTVTVDDCRTAHGPTGEGHVRLRFAPDGYIVDAWTDVPPFAGTEVGACVEKAFIGGGRIPPYHGGPVTIGKSFVIGRNGPT